MADVFSVAKRSEIMGRVRSRGNQATEVRLVEIFRAYRITGWRRHTAMYGNPDFVFHAARLVVFVDGCFWHGCPTHGMIPTTNRDFWVRKIEANKKRDRMVRKGLTAAGWRIIRIWQHELRHPEKVVRRVRRSISKE